MRQRIRVDLRDRPIASDRRHIPKRTSGFMLHIPIRQVDAFHCTGVTRARDASLVAKVRLSQDSDMRVDEGYRLRTPRREMQVSSMFKGGRA